MPGFFSEFIKTENPHPRASSGIKKTILTLHARLNEISDKAEVSFGSPKRLAAAHRSSSGKSSEHNWHRNAGATRGFPLRCSCLSTGNR